MAFNSIIRRASSSILPLARSVSSRRTFHSAISAIVGVEKQSLGRKSVHRQLFLPFSRFSTSADSKLLGVLESEIDCTEEPSDVEEIIPVGFPFEIKDNPGERTILLERKYQDEIIKVEVDAPIFPEDEDEDGDDEKNTDESATTSRLPLTVSIHKGNGQCLEFGITAFPDEIAIDTLSIKNPDASEGQLAYEGPDFSDLDENLQKAFLKYLEIRGIKPSITNALFDYMGNKDNREYLLWLKNLKSFVEK